MVFGMLQLAHHLRPFATSSTSGTKHKHGIENGKRMAIIGSIRELDGSSIPMASRHCVNGSVTILGRGKSSGSDSK
jgi:hypothetical protein